MTLGSTLLLSILKYKIMKSLKRYFILTSILFFGVVNNILSQTYNWENSSTINFLPVGSEAYNNNQLIDLTYDNYGTHFIGISNFNSSTLSGNLNYFLFDNNGLIVNNESYVEIETGVRGLSICSGFGRVFFISVKDNSIGIYERLNGINNYQLKLTFVPTDPQISSDLFVNTSLAITEGKLHIVWQNKSPSFGNNYIGYAVYDFINQIITEYDIINDANSLGNHPQIAASGSKVEITYTRFFNQNTSQDIFNTVDVSNAPTYIVRTASGWITSSNNEAYSRSALLIQDNIAYIIGKTAILSLGQVGINSQFKKRTFTGDWPTLSTINEYFVNGYNTKPSLIYVPENNRVAFSYEARYYPPGNPSRDELRYREYDIQSQTLLNPITCEAAPPNEYIYFSLLRGSIHGDYIIFRSGNNFKKIRRPRPITGNITYNTLLTGTEYINTSTSSSCHSNGAKIIAENGSSTTVAANSQLYIDQGDCLELKSGSTLNILDNAHLIVDGNNASLKLNPNSIVQLGENAKIEFKNGAYLIANGSAISSAQGSHGGGIVLENAGEQTSITNCTFTNLMSSIIVKNTDAGYFGLFKNISDNTFYTDVSCLYVIETKNANNITISNNHIFMTQGRGVGILMRYYINEGNEESASTTYAVNVMGNEISNGVVSAAFISFTNSYPYINFKYNNCYGSVSNTNVIYRLSHGNIKNNNISNSSGKNLDLFQANPYVLSNSFYSYILNLTNNDSYPYFAPISTTTDGGWVWRGGKNTLSSSSNGNIYFKNGNVVLDWGQNYFSKSYYNYHLQGRINEPSGVYNVRNNCFNGSHNPSSSLTDYYSGNDVIPYYAGSYISCAISTDAGTIWQIDDLGNGFYDTLYRTDNNSGYQPEEDEGLYSSAIEKQMNDDNYGAVSTFKTLINLHPQSSYTEACLYDMYDCYQKLDTSANQSTHDILYSDLKYFLDSKIESGLYSDEFNINAYNITVMCLVSISQYYEAMSGYEFIALYHPDDYLSFLASWDYAEIEDLMNGSGGISSTEENLTQEEYYKKLKKRIDRKINEDPVKKMVKKSFDRTKAAKISKIEKDAMSRTNSNETAKQEIAKMESKYEEAKMKAISIMRTSKSLTREEKDRKQIEDILLTKTEENKETESFSNIVPAEYSLSQNYPNPFNPNTKINFALPKQGFVTLKIYDITGREIKTLVNEIKQAGYYTVDFNGSNLSSGVYFYKIQTGDFSSVKRMVLVK